jgi:hypothetical protein
MWMTAKGEHGDACKLRIERVKALFRSACDGGDGPQHDHRRDRVLCRKGRNAERTANGAGTRDQQAMESLSRRSVASRRLPGQLQGNHQGVLRNSVNVVSHVFGNCFNARSSGRPIKFVIFAASPGFSSASLARLKTSSPLPRLLTLLAS